jgi:hypothetical protein
MFGCLVLFWALVWAQTGELDYATGFWVGGTAVGFAVYDIYKQFVPMDINGNYDYRAYGGIRHILTREELKTFRQTGYYDLWIFHVVFYSM